MTCLRLYSLGFRHYSDKRLFRSFPPRPLTLLSRASNIEDLSYWYRPQRSVEGNPVLFLHGIGVRESFPGIQDAQYPLSRMLIRYFIHRSDYSHTLLFSRISHRNTRTSVSSSLSSFPSALASHPHYSRAAPPSLRFSRSSIPTPSDTSSSPRTPTVPSSPLSSFVPQTLLPASQRHSSSIRFPFYSTFPTSRIISCTGHPEPPTSGCCGTLRVRIRTCRVRSRAISFGRKISSGGKISKTRSWRSR